MPVPPLDTDVTPGLRMRTLTTDDAPLLVEATATETGRAVWGPSPVGPYTLGDARAALQEWTGDQISYGLLDGDHLVAAFGLMLDPGDTAELAYWVPPHRRRHGHATLGLGFLTTWSLSTAGLRQVWLEIDPVNTASRAVAARAGFRYDCRKPDHCIDPDSGQPHDCLIYLKP